MKSWLKLKQVFHHLIPLALGLMAFVVVAGPLILDPTNISWLGTGDPATHFLGWHFFRNSEWSFPIGLNPDYGIELSNAIVFSDSLPLLAILFKLLSSLLPETFQYFGLWLLLCFMLQAWFGWKLVGILTDNSVLRVLATGFFIFSPPMLFRLYGHLSLVGHFIILASLFLILRSSRKYNYLFWGGVLSVAAMVHPYFLAMTSALCSATHIESILKTDQRWKTIVPKLLLIILIIACICWQVGYFTVGNGVSLIGYGYYKMNALSPFDANEWSYILQDFPNSPGEGEGFNFFGLGVIFLFISAIPLLFNEAADLVQSVKRRSIFLLLLIFLTAFALTNNLGIGSMQIEIPLPEGALRVANVFRASGRMFWPVYYVILFTTIFIVIRGYDTRAATLLVAIALFIQVVDTSAGWSKIHDRYMISSSSAWSTPLKDPFWSKAAHHYDKARWSITQNNSPNWKTIATYAAKNGLATDAVYLARVNEEQLRILQTKMKLSLESGQFDQDTIYFLDESSLSLAVLHHDQSVDLLAKVDGFNILAPGWKRCSDCPKVESEIHVSDIFTPSHTGEIIYFSKSAKGIISLVKGWSGSEEWGTWSDGRSATIILPVSIENPKTLVFEVNAFVTPSHPNQNFEIWVNKELAKTVTLSNYAENLIKVDIPLKARRELEKSKRLHIDFKFSNPASPKDLKLSTDSRELSIGLLRLTLF